MLSPLLVRSGYAAIGVKEGDWARYQIEAQLPEDMAGMEDLEAFEQLAWVKVEVVSVSSTSVTLNMTIHYANGTDIVESMPGTGFVIDTDLGEGDEVSSPMFSTGIPMYIDGVKQRTVAGASREVSYVEYDLSELGMTMNIEICWDKATGILCEMAMSMSGEFAGETLDMSMLIKMIETNLWAGGLGALFQSDEGALALAIAILICLMAVAGVAYLVTRRGKAPAPEAEPTPVEAEQA